MSLFYSKKKQSSVTAFLPALFFALLLGCFVLFSDSFSKSNLQQEKQILQDALKRSVIQCYALEGAYPINLRYLEEHYGLTYSKEHFFVDYQYIGSNLYPDITIIERN